MPKNSHFCLPVYPTYTLEPLWNKEVNRVNKVNAIFHIPLYKYIPLYPYITLLIYIPICNYVYLFTTSKNPLFQKGLRGKQQVNRGKQNRWNPYRSKKIPVYL